MRIYRGRISKATLRACFQEAKEKSARYIGIAIRSDNKVGAEVLVFGSELFEENLKYYESAYDDTLRSVIYPYHDKIIAIAYSESFGSLARLLTKC